MRIIEQKINRYQTNKLVCYNFGDIDPQTLEWIGYFKQSGISKMVGVSIWDFDSITYQKTVGNFVHCWALKSKIVYFINLKIVK